MYTRFPPFSAQSQQDTSDVSNSMLDVYIGYLMTVSEVGAFEIRGVDLMRSICCISCSVIFYGQVVLWKIIKSYLRFIRGSVIVCGTMLQAGRSRVRFPMRSLEFSINLILPAALWP
jgi:hypothetical protein